ncbi:hypothetical protein GCM10027417_16440 [Glutamicibacter endophyticus]
MDLASIIILISIIVLCALPICLGLYRSWDSKADRLEGSDPEVAQALRDMRRDIERGRDAYRNR